MSDYDKQYRALEKKLERTQRHLIQLEQVRDRDRELYRKMTAEIEGAREIIERKNETLEQQRDELASTLRELQSAQTRLIQAEKMASLGQLTAGVAHEIKNPLNFVNNFAEVCVELAEELAELLEQDSSGDQAEARDVVIDLKKSAAEVAKHGKRADGIVRSMMQHARASSFDREATDFNALVNETVDLANFGAGDDPAAADVDFVRSFGSDVGKVEMAPSEIGRVVLNVVNNALYAVVLKARTISGSQSDYRPVVKISTARHDGVVELQISDNGTGIPENTKNKIFEPFYTTKPTGEGTGLGLSISYDIVTHGHEGTMTVESTEGEGTTFVIRLPG